MFKKRSATNLTTSSHLLAGLVYCGKCGAKMRYQPWGKSGHKFMCYSQQTYKPYLIKDKNCDQEKIDCNIVEDIVINRLFQLKEERRDMTNKEYNISAIDVLLQQKKSLENKIRRLYNLYAGQSDDLLLITINENKEALHEIELKIKSEKKQLEDVSNSNTVKNAVDTLSDQWYCALPAKMDTK